MRRVSDETTDDRADPVTDGGTARATGEGLAERSAEMVGLREAEREWIAESEGDWTAGAAASRRSLNAEVDKIRPAQPTTVRVLPGVGPDDAAALADAGISSVRQLTWVDAGEIADLLDLDVRQVRLWRHAAREHRRGD